jgi:hypothetical protein
MSRYADIAANSDPAIALSETHLERADRLVDAELLNKGVALAEVAGGHPLLAELALAYAQSIAAREQARGEGGLMMAKAKNYEGQAKIVADKVTRAALDLAQSAGGGYGTVSLRRG